MGITDPAHDASVSFGHTTTNLLLHNPNIDRIIICKVLRKIIDDIDIQCLAVPTSHGREIG